MCDARYGVAGWLRQEELMHETVVVPKRSWMRRLTQEWQALSGWKLEPRRPRHSVEETTSRFSSLPDADPRLRLLIERAAERRAGQAVRATRSHLLPGPVPVPLRGGEGVRTRGDRESLHVSGRTPARRQGEAGPVPAVAPGSHGDPRDGSEVRGARRSRRRGRYGYGCPRRPFTPLRRPPAASARRPARTVSPSSAPPTVRAGSRHAR